MRKPAIFLLSAIVVLVSSIIFTRLSPQNTRPSVVIENYLPLSSQPSPAVAISEPNTPPVNFQNGLSTAEIFRYTDPEVEVGSGLGEYTLLATGDVIPARSVNVRMTKLKNFNYPFEKPLIF